MRLLGTLLFLLFLSGLRGTEGRKESGGEEDRARDRAVGGSSSSSSSGEFTSRESHRCAWETSGGRAGLVELRVSCSQGALSYRCRYAGRPHLCPAYAARSAQYWKQAVGKLKKRRNACEGQKVLKTRVCRKAPAEAQLRLEEEEEEEERGRGKEEEERERGGGKEEEEERGRGGGKEQEEEERGRGGGEEEERGRGGGKEQEEEERGRAGGKEEEERGRGGGKEEEVRREGGKEKEVHPAEEDRVAFGEVNDGNVEAEPVERYCAEGWQSFCSFFVKFIDG